MEQCPMSPLMPMARPHHLHPASLLFANENINFGRESLLCENKNME